MNHRLSDLQTQRPYLLPDRRVRWDPIRFCECTKDERRGPDGGVCGNCGCAIPSLYESGWIELYLQDDSWSANGISQICVEKFRADWEIDQMHKEVSNEK